MVSRITGCLWRNTTQWANSTVYVSGGTHKASRVQNCLLCLGEPRGPAREQLLLFLATISFGCYVCRAGKNKRPKVDSRKEQQTLVIQFLTLLISNSRFFLSFLKPQGFLHFLELCQGMGMHVGVKCKEHTLEANMVGPTKNCELLSHTLPAPQHFLLSLGFYPLQKYLVSWGSC